MSASVPMPACFLPTVGEPAIPFSTWKKIFQNYLLVIGARGDAWPDARLRAVLLHCLGTEGQRLFYTLPNGGTTYDEAMAALDAHFTPRVNVVAARHKFRQRAQRIDETVSQFIAELRHLAVDCQFGGMEDEMLRDQLIERVFLAAVRDRLLLESELTLDRASELALQVESAVQNATLLSNTGSSPAQVQAISKTKGSFKRGKQNYDKMPVQTGKPQNSNKRRCFRCGSNTHLANAHTCPAVSATCHQCGKRGHFAKVCKSAAVREVVVPELTVLCVNQSQDKIRCQVQLEAPQGNKIPLELIVDTGSSVSILPETLFMKHFANCELKEPQVRLVTYSREQLPTLGCFTVSVSHDGVATTANFYVVKTGSPLLGMDLIKALKCHIVGDRIVTLSSPAASPVLEICNAAASSPGCVKGFVHKVQIDESVKPVQHKLRRLPLSVREEVSKEINRLLGDGVIEKIDASPWVSPIVVTRKKSGEIRVCVDLREPNRAVITDCFPLPHMEDLFTELRGATVFSQIDLQSAYHQLPLHEESQNLTAFITHDGLFKFTKVPFGLASAPSAFQKMMKTVLEGLPGVQNYLDDLIVYGQNKATHDANLQAVMTRLTDIGLKLNMKKSKFGQSRIRYLGHDISKEGLHPNPDSVEAIANAPAPTDLPSLRSFLGLTSWFSKFIPNYAMVVDPLREILRSSQNGFTWTEAAEASFRRLKQLLVHSPALALFDPFLPTFVSTDASDYGIGGVISQRHPDQTERPIAFASRTLTPAERKYSTVEKEALACVWTVERWRTYLWGRKFTLKTDHQALTTLLATRGMNRAGMRIARWSARLLCFNYNLEYRPGKTNCVADCLSRLPLPDSDAGQEEELGLVAEISKDLSKAIPMKDLLEACKSCPELSKLHAQITQGWPKSQKQMDPTIMAYFQIRHELAVDDKYILRGQRLVVPIALRSKLIHLAHEGHQGVVRTKQRLRDLYWWPRMDYEVHSSIASCSACQSCDKTARTCPAPLQPVDLPDGPFQKVAIDIVGPFERATQDCRFAITMVDYYSKWPEVAFTSNVTTNTVTKFLASVFAREGNPLTLVSDNGPQFVSSAFADFLTERGIKHIRSSVYWPQANGAVERWNRVLKNCIQVVEMQQLPWKQAVTDFLLNYRATPHATTGVSPFELLRGRKMRTKLNTLPTTAAQDEKGTMGIRDHVQRVQQKMKLYSDKKRGAKPPPFKCGDRVRVRKPMHVPKAGRKFTVPMLVNKKLGPSTYVLSDGKKWNAAHLSLVPETTQMTLENAQVNPGTENVVYEPVKSTRARQPPVWLKDYATE